ncbi:hypothetical protein UCDDA912_g03138 [Diaporthe ampelina]|uniref:Uncharacterized protein n=1 Tax=Diaporthe ampelina TaxID=1214573 RepID=A0A0G2FSE2_9PEZI|nr:hypothetical protein UCDDA912_g03138 [Diaporthe ampelina]
MDPPASEARRFSFFDFPAEIRNIIYHCSLHRPDCADLYRSYYRQAAAQPRGQRWHRAHLKTPTILLLCRRITDESMPVLRAQWFIIDRLPPCMAPMPDGRGGFLRMSNFIGRETLQRLHYIDLRIGLGEGPLGSGWIWNRVLDELLGILAERNALVHFRLLIRRCNQEDSPSIWTTEVTEEVQVRKHKSEADSSFEPLSRSYPDRELFPGSIMEFVDALPEADWSDEEEGG